MKYLAIFGLAFGLASALTATAQIWSSPVAAPFQLPAAFNVVYAFSAATNYVTFLGYTNWEGAFCTAPLVQASNGRLYGVAPSGGDLGGGTVFSLSPGGTNVTVLHTFTAMSYVSNPAIGLYWQANNDGNNPTGLILGRDGKLYGTTVLGGTNGFGMIFTLKCDGTAFTNLHNFTANDGEHPQGGLVQGPEDIFYGTAEYGGTNGSGTVFRLRADGSGFAVIHHFTSLISNTNLDGTQPHGGLILSSNGKLYGTARYGGPGGGNRSVGPSPVGSGTIFSLGTNGADFTVLHAFAPLSFSSGFFNPTNEDGASPYSALLLGRDGKLHGTAPEAGPGAAGTIFCLDTNGDNYAVQKAYYEMPSPPNFQTAAYGLYPYGGLIEGDDGFLYGAAFGGGILPGGGFFAGTVYRLAPDGSGLALLHSFREPDQLANTNSDGMSPFTTLLQAKDGRVYGVTSAGGWNGSGTVFAFTPPVLLQVASSNGYVTLSWPAAATNFVLETSGSISADSVWTPLTNSVSTGGNSFAWPRSGNDSTAFFRLHQQ